MDSPFDAYYYDEHGRKREAEDDAATKLDAATQSLCALTEQLHAEDRLGVVPLQPPRPRRETAP